MAQVVFYASTTLVLVILVAIRIAHLDYQLSRWW